MTGRILLKYRTSRKQSIRLHSRLTYGKKDTSQDLVYIKLLSELRKLINIEYKDGGRFPSSREICERMGVNRNTYIKALSRLVADGYVRNYRQRGVYVTPDRFRCHKIGLVIGSGEDSPFIYQKEIISRIFSEITNENFDIYFEWEEI